MRGQSEEYCVDSLLQNCILSSAQILDTKYEMLVEALKEIVPGIEISFTINLISPKKNLLPLLNKNEYADLLFFFLKQKFSNHLFSLFDEDVMQQSLVFKGKMEGSISKEMESFIFDLKSGMKLKGVYNKYINDKNSFCTYLLYVLLKGNVYFSQSGSNVKYYHLYERYQSLSKFINKIKTPEKLFLHLSGCPTLLKISNNETKAAYLYFIKHNHPDKFAFDIPEDLSELIHKNFSKVKRSYELTSDLDLKAQEEQKRKKADIQREVLLAEKKKICERYLEKKQYIQAFSLIESVPQKVIEKELYWQLLYLWLHFENNNVNTKLSKAHEYMKNAQSQARELVKEKLYHYVLGLYHESKENFSQAKACFNKTKVLDPSFPACYPAINRCSLKLIKEQKAKKVIFSKLVDSFKDLGKKQKKIG